MTRQSLGVCYYPEHWPEEQWEREVARHGASLLRPNYFFAAIGASFVTLMARE